jgi:hypothetical protein
MPGARAVNGSRPLRLPSAPEIAAFENDGFVVLPGVLDPAWLDGLEAACARLLLAPDALDITEETLRLALPQGALGLFGAAPYKATLEGRGRFRMHFNTARRDAAVLDFALRGAAGGIAAALMHSAEVRFVDDILFVKEPRTEEPTEWHDDDGGGVATGTQRCSVWVTLADAPEQAGPVRFLRGSHRRFQGWRAGGFKAAVLAEQHAGDVVSCPLRVGDVVVHHLDTIHAAGPNRSAEPRRSWALRFAGDDARFILRPARREEREWYGLADGDRLGGPRFPVAWPVANSGAGAST